MVTTHSAGDVIKVMWKAMDSCCILLTALVSCQFSRVGLSLLQLSRFSVVFDLFAYVRGLYDVCGTYNEKQLLMTQNE